MRVELDTDERKLKLRFEAAEELRSFAVAALCDQGFVVQLPSALVLFEQLLVGLSDGTTRLEIPAQVIQVFPGSSGEHSTALQVLDAAPLRRIEASVARERETEGGEMTDASPAFRIRKLNVTQKMMLAAKASRAERQILVRDISPQVLMGLLGNPRIEDKEVLEIIKSTHAASGVLQRVANARRWSGNYAIRLAVVRNPKTPPVLAQKLLPTLRKKDLGVLAKGSTVREAVKGAALRLYLTKI